MHGTRALINHALSRATHRATYRVIISSRRRDKTDARRDIGNEIRDDRPPQNRNRSNLIVNLIVTEIQIGRQKNIIADWKR